MRLLRAAACRSLTGCLLALSFAVSAAAQPPPTVLDLAMQQKNLTAFVGAVHSAGLDDMLRGPGPLTVYAPTDDAFAKMPAAERTALFANPERLRAMVLGVLVKDSVVMRDGDRTVTSGYVPSAGGGNLTFAVDDGQTQTVNGARLVRADMRAANGIVDEIDSVPDK